jgi:hypothetical protein
MKYVRILGVLSVYLLSCTATDTGKPDTHNIKDAGILDAPMMNKDTGETASVDQQLQYDVLIETTVIPDVGGVCTFSEMCDLVAPKFACCCGGASKTSLCCPKMCSMIATHACLINTKVCLTFCSDCIPQGWKEK